MFFQKLYSFEATTSTGKKLKDKLCMEVNNRFQNIEAVKMYAAATILDPRFKKQAFHNIRDAAGAETFVGECNTDNITPYADIYNGHP